MFNNYLFGLTRPLTKIVENFLRRWEGLKKSLVLDNFWGEPLIMIHTERETVYDFKEHNT